MDEHDEGFNFDMLLNGPKIKHQFDFKNKPMLNKLKNSNAILKAKSLFKGTKLVRRKIKLIRHKKIRRDKDKESKSGNEEGKTYDCKHPMCDKVFNDRNSYRKHLIIHGEKQFICQAEGCGKKFLDNSKLRRHMLVHSGTKAYKCELCTKRFSLDFNLRTHLRIHTGEKPYVCSYEGCYKRFSQSSNLSAHEKTHFLFKQDEEEEIGGKKKIFRVIRAIPEPPKPIQVKKPVIILDRDKYERQLEEQRKKHEEEREKEREKEKERQLQKENSIENINNLINSSKVTNENIESKVNILLNKAKPELKQFQEIRNTEIVTEDIPIPFYLTRENALNELLSLIKQYKVNSY